MGTYILLGHGGLHPQKLSYAEGMDTVAVPPGTTLQFTDVDVASERWDALAKDLAIDDILIPDYSLEPPYLLCNGTPGSCPVDPQKKSKHNCDGILGGAARFVQYFHEDLNDKEQETALTDPDLAAAVATHPWPA